MVEAIWRIKAPPSTIEIVPPQQPPHFSRWQTAVLTSDWLMVLDVVRVQRVDATADAGVICDVCEDSVIIASGRIATRAGGRAMRRVVAKEVMSH